MELNKDCIRDVLIKCEELLVMDDDGKTNHLSISNLSEALPDYDVATIRYTVIKMEEAGLLKVSTTRADNLSYIFVYDITYEGHELLDKIKEDNNWKTIKSYAAKVGSFSLSVLQQIAINMFTKKIDNIIWGKHGK